MKTNLQRYVMQRLEEGGGCQGVLYSTTVQRCVQPRCWGTGGDCTGSSSQSTPVSDQSNTDCPVQ